MRRHLLVGALVLLAGPLSLAVWAATTRISGAVMANGRIVAGSEVKKVQHAEGGIVGELHVVNGDHVKAGDILVRLDATLIRANLAIVSKALDDLTIRKARLEAERDERTRVSFPQALQERRDDPELARALNAAEHLFEVRRIARNGQKAQLRQRIAELHDEMRGDEAQLSAKAREIAHIKVELTGAHKLWGQNLMPISKLTALEREATRVEGEHGQLMAAIAQVKGKISETDLQIMQVDRDQASSVGNELQEVETKIGEYVERKVAAEDRLKRIDIRAPQDGIVHQSVIHTVGGVVNAGETVMSIVPSGDDLAVDADVAPQDVDRLTPGQSVTLRFVTFNQHSTPEIKGTSAAGISRHHAR